MICFFCQAVSLVLKNLMMAEDETAEKEKRKCETETANVKRT